MSTDSTDLIVMNALTAEAVFCPGGVDAIIEKIAAAARAVPADISTTSGRAAIKSIAYKVARSRTALDEMGKDLAAEWKKKSAAIDSERRDIRERLEALQEEVRKPLTDWENAEKNRVAAHEAKLTAITELGVFVGTEPGVESILDRISILAESRFSAHDWQEFTQRAAITIAGVTASLQSAHAAAVKRDADRAELERLRQEQAKREQHERELRIAAEASERARKEAEEKAAHKAALAERAAREDREKSERAKAQAEQAARDAEVRAKKEKADRIAAQTKAKDDAERAARKAAQDKEAAIVAERKRVADAAAADAKEVAKREADKKHRAAINRTASEAFIAGGLSEEAARIAITLIAKKVIPNVTIQY
jgi:hypothetical protein